MCFIREKALLLQNVDPTLMNRKPRDIFSLKGKLFQSGFLQGVHEPCFEAQTCPQSGWASGLKKPSPAIQSGS